MSLKERLRAAMDAAGVSNTQLADACGVSVQAVGKWLKSGQVAREHLPVISTLLSVSADWLLEGGDEGTVREETARYTKKELQGWDHDHEIDQSEFAMLPEMSIEASAGLGYRNHVEQEKHKVPFSRRTLAKRGVEAEHAIIIRVIGNSMAPLLCDQDTIGINTADTAVVDGKGYAIRDIDMTRIKFLYHRPGGGLLLRSFNRDEYPDEELTRDEVEQRISVLGRVFWSSRLW